MARQIWRAIFGFYGPTIFIMCSLTCITHLSVLLGFHGPPETIVFIGSSIQA